MIKKQIKLFFPEIILFIAAVIFSCWLMWHTFYVDHQTIHIATKVWSDFASHLPLIRSFSFGYNFPIQYPLFAGEIIRYHFLFDMLTGLLERIGLPIDLSFNLLSSFSFTLLILAIYFLAKKLFDSRLVGFLSAVFFLFNGSLSFLEYFKENPISFDIKQVVLGIYHNSNYPSFGPYDQKIVSAFWNLNIYTNQRHLALPLALFLLLLLTIAAAEKSRKIINKKLVIFWAIFLGILPFLHSSIFITSVLVLACLILLLPKQRVRLLLILIIGLGISLPRILFLKETASYSPQFIPGYLIANNLTILNFLRYWFFNLGLLPVLAILGIIISSKLNKKVFLAIFLIFILGNLFQFSPEMAGNHKFFNIFVIVVNMFAAFFIVKIWRSKKYLKIFVPILILGLTLSGIIDFFPLKNDTTITIDDYPKNSTIKWIKDNTPANSVFLDNNYLYNPSSLAGRKIFLGWPYFSWSLGYDVTSRETKLKQILTASSKAQACILLKNNHINYVEIKKLFPDQNLPKISDVYLNNFSSSFQDSKGEFEIISVAKNCF
ncbi:hypothetical protein HY025_03490 [Candidatus Daviesbacteria bacterium]|nr:hypothetical protein [Candidatus Daviesbacteria bacterium]